MPESPAGPGIVDLASRELAVFAPPQIRAWVKGARTQVIQLHPALVGPLRDSKRTDGKAQTFLFRNRTGGPMHRRTVERLTGIWGRKAKVVNCIPHRFRHSFGTELLRKTNDIRAVQEALGARRHRLDHGVCPTERGPSARDL